METKEYRYRDRSKWGSGEWDDEPDKIQWEDEATGLPCLVVRGPSGAWCGYVGVDATHPYFEKDYDDCHVDVHGGLTFASFCQEDAKERGVCHVVEPGENDRVWWLGFDCIHLGDLAPEETYNSCAGYESYYKDLPYVRRQVLELARQLAELP